MRKNSHFSGQPLYGQVIKLRDKSKILDFSRENGGERYTKRFNCWIHLVVMLKAVMMRFDSLMEINQRSATRPERRTVSVSEFDTINMKGLLTITSVTSSGC